MSIESDKLISEGVGTSSVEYKPCFSDAEGTYCAFSSFLAMVLVEGDVEVEELKGVGRLIIGRDKRQSNLFSVT